jgi:hypothetical protein
MTTQHNSLFPASVAYLRKRMTVFCLSVLLLTAIVCSASILTSCGEEAVSPVAFKEHNTLEDLAYTLKTSNKTLLWQVEFPEGTVFTTQADGIHYQLPKDMEFIGVVKETNELEVFSAGTITCTCKTEGGGMCEPVKAGSRVGCMTDANTPCAWCEMKTSQSGFARYKQLYLAHGKSSEQGYFAMMGAVHPIIDQSSLKAFLALPNVEQSSLTKQSVVNELDGMLSEAYKTVQQDYKSLPPTTSSVPNGCALIPIVVDKTRAYMVVPKQAVEKGMIELVRFQTPYYPSPTTGKAQSLKDFTTSLELGSVYCTGCDGQCHLESEYWKKVLYCTGCNGCTLHW